MLRNKRTLIAIFFCSEKIRAFFIFSDIIKIRLKKGGSSMNDSKWSVRLLKAAAYLLLICIVFEGNLGLAIVGFLIVVYLLAIAALFSLDEN